MKAVVYFDPATGQISSTKNVQDHMIEANCPAGMQWMIPDPAWQPSPEDYYVVTGSFGPDLFSKPAMPVSYGATEITTEENITITGIPADATFTHPDGTAQITAGAVTWGSDVPGDFFLFLDRFPYKQVKINVTVIPA